MRRGKTSAAALNFSVTLLIEKHQHLICCDPDSLSVKAPNWFLRRLGSRRKWTPSWNHQFAVSPANATFQVEVNKRNQFLTKK
jgi:hypothetical protein